MAEIRGPEDGKSRLWSAALYLRLSREDGDREESDSIGNQRSLLLSFLGENPQLELYDIYIDDGYSGLNFNRPAFRRMIGDMEQKRINCIVVKDLSRFGRDYIGVGGYQEYVFPKFQVRFIALNDNVDTYLKNEDGQGILLPITNLLNEQYARDISKKVRSALDTKRRRGEFIGAFASYGYRKDPHNHNRLLPDEDAAENVRLIFRLFLEGMPKLAIAKQLNERNIPCPSEYKRLNGQNYANPGRLPHTTYWTLGSVDRILNNEVYIGNLVQHTQSRGSLKLKQNVKVSRSDWIISEGTHEPLIDPETWETAQRLLASRVKKSRCAGTVHLFAGLLRCADCGRAMKKRSGCAGRYSYYICGTYQAYGKERCPSHSIRVNTLCSLVFEEVKAQLKQSADIEYIKEQLLKRNALRQRELERRMKEWYNKKQKLIALRQNLYEDLKTGILDREEYFAYKSRYAKELEKLEQCLKKCREEQGGFTADEKTEWVEQALADVLEPQELTRALLVTLIKSILIHKDGTVTIHFSFRKDAENRKASDSNR